MQIVYLILLEGKWLYPIWYFLKIIKQIKVEANLEKLVKRFNAEGSDVELYRLSVQS